MGACLSNPDYQPILKNSVLASFIPDNEWDEFVRLWKCETYSTQKHICMKPSHAMYIVTSGSIHAYIQKTNMTDVTWNNVSKHGNKIEVFETGDVIHMFSNKLRVSDGSIVYKDVQVLYFPVTSQGKVCSVASLAVDDIQRYVDKIREDNDSKDIIESLKWLFKMNIGHILSEKNMTYRLSQEQVSFSIYYQCWIG